ncbi:hypothetical protein [Methylobacterium sp. J-076]|uniref:hypothetical protein n=1 Tax=Methylobacterium sp. J-076 TaxID=2836655 RepID=UPI001FBBF76F|nr:hypothetical protein [Methylobacterium sp. J-076]MCJ2015598.1 hypothetical protein [Methylobacterium sp. J-076]
MLDQDGVVGGTQVRRLPIMFGEAARKGHHAPLHVEMTGAVDDGSKDRLVEALRQQRGLTDGRIGVRRGETCGGDDLDPGVPGPERTSACEHIIVRLALQVLRDDQLADRPFVALARNRLPEAIDHLPGVELGAVDGEFRAKLQVHVLHHDWRHQNTLERTHEGLDEPSIRHIRMDVDHHGRQLPIRPSNQLSLCRSAAVRGEKHHDRKRDQQGAGSRSQKPMTTRRR